MLLEEPATPVVAVRARLATPVGMQELCEPLASWNFDCGLGQMITALSLFNNGAGRDVIARRLQEHPVGGLERLDTIHRPPSIGTEDAYDTLPLHEALARCLPEDVVLVLVRALEGASARGSDTHAAACLALGMLMHPLHLALLGGYSAAVVGPLITAESAGFKGRGGLRALHLAVTHGASAACVSQLLASFPEGASKPSCAARDPAPRRPRTAPHATQRSALASLPERPCL